MKSDILKRRTREEIELSLRLTDRINDLLREDPTRQIRCYKTFGSRQWHRFFEHGNNPTFYMLCKLADCLDVPLSEILKFDMTKKIEQVSESEWFIDGRFRLCRTEYIRAKGPE
jgi:transcriptional regulator with XRE-family HTH domain